MHLQSLVASSIIFLIVAHVTCFPHLSSLIWEPELFFQQLSEDMQSLKMTVSLHLQNSQAPVVYSITPSSDCKSSREILERFRRIMDAMSLGSTCDLLSFVQDAPHDCTSCTYEAFTFNWKAGSTGLPENASYGLLVEYVEKSTKAKAKDISAGQDLTKGLFYDVNLHTLRPRVGVRSNELRVDHSEPKIFFHLSGRSDVVVWDARH